MKNLNLLSTKAIKTGVIQPHESRVKLQSTKKTRVTVV